MSAIVTAHTAPTAEDEWSLLERLASAPSGELSLTKETIATVCRLRDRGLIDVQVYEGAIPEVFDDARISVTEAGEGLLRLRRAMRRALRA